MHARVALSPTTPVRLTPTERDRLLLFTVAELARARRARGVLLNVPEATALIADAVCEAVFDDGTRLAVVTDPFGGGHLGADVSSGPADRVALSRLYFL